MEQLIPKDSLTERLMVEVLTRMYKHEIEIKKTVTTSEFPRPDAATADTQSAQTDTQTDSTTILVSGQNNDKELQLSPNNKDQPIEQTFQSSLVSEDDIQSASCPL